MPVKVIVGAQWGDEGKGKIVDVLSEDADIVARYQGGANAGHTVIIKGKEHILHVIPSGILREKTAVLGNRVLLDARQYQKEKMTLESQGINVDDHFFVSDQAPLTLPHHSIQDYGLDLFSHLGTTKQGIGTTYAEWALRIAIPIGKAMNKDAFKAHLELYREYWNHGLEFLTRKIYEEKLNDAGADKRDKFFLDLKDFYTPWTGLIIDNIVDEYHGIISGLEGRLVDIQDFMEASISQGKRIIAEGAQSSPLRTTSRAYPFVTSSNTGVSGVCESLVIPPNMIGIVHGITKAIMSRVGDGGFPTEFVNYDAIRNEIPYIEALKRKYPGISDQDAAKELLTYQKRMLEKINSGEATPLEISQYFRNIKPYEYGATTLRPRRLGWYDIAALAREVKSQGITQIVITRLDSLDGLNEFKVCTKYTKAGTPIYQTIKGPVDLSKGIDAPIREFIGIIEEELGIPVTIVSYGPDREQTEFYRKVA
jgi:adenylosuccinate synthase